MKFVRLTYIVSILCFSLCCKATDTLNLVPMPVSVKMLAGQFLFNSKTTIVAVKPNLVQAQYLQQELKALYGLSLRVIEVDKISNKKNCILLSPQPYQEYSSSVKDTAEKYRLFVSKESVQITGEKAGIFYGIQTLLQLMPDKKIPNFAIPAVDIYDYPRFQYRGMHLDVSRHFFDVNYIKRYIDYLAFHKFNTLHWHLTDDQGWRIEIKKYPKLKEIGSCRDRTLVGRFGSKVYDSIKYCGIYTQEEVKELVKYAHSRNVAIIPEIDVPGHTQAAIASYPYLGCTGKQVGVLQTWGSTPESMCPGKESSYTFLNDVLDEVIPLFPLPYIHIGGDETIKTNWADCPDCKKRMADNNLKSLDQLQAYFINRIEQHVASKGRTIIGWDEIMEGDAKTSGVVMSWRGEKTAATAVKKGWPVIMTPESFVYFDYSQTRNEDSITIGNFLPVEKVYAWEPVPAILDSVQAKLIIGAQGNVWTEYITNPKKLEYMLFPRMSALSEVLWSPKSQRNWGSFEARLPLIFKRYRFRKINYSKAYYEMQPSTQPSEDYSGLFWKISSRSRSLITIIDSVKNISVAGNNEVRMKVEHTGTYIAVMKSDDGSTSAISQQFSYNKATGKKITLAIAPNAKYSAGGGFALVDGVITTRGMNQSSKFLGFLATDFDATVDLGETTTLRKVTLNVFGQEESWIYLPSSVTFMFLDENNNPVATVEKAIPEDNKRLRKVTAETPVDARYVRIVAMNYGKIPAGKPGAGTKPWLFCDEIEIE